MSLPNNIDFRKIKSVPIIRKDGKVDEISTVRVGETVKLSNGTVTVFNACKLDSGVWRCVTHAEILPSQLSKDSHISKGTHRLAWQCFEHGVEQP